MKKNLPEPATRVYWEYMERRVLKAKATMTTENGSQQDLRSETTEAAPLKGQGNARKQCLIH